MAKKKAPANRPVSGIVVVLVLGMIFAGLMFGIVAIAGRHGQGRPAEKVYFVIAPTLKVRTLAQPNAPILTSVDREAKVEILEDSGVWVKVRTVDGSIGWAERSQIAGRKEYERRMARTRTIRQLPALEGFVTMRTALYAGPGHYYPILGQVAAEAKVKVYTRDHDFYAIDYAGTIAYAEVDAIELARQASEELEVAAADSTSPGSADPAGAETVLPDETKVAPPITEWTPQLSPDPIGVYPAVPPGGTQPQVVRRVNPSYPPGARAQGIDGIVVIRAIVRKDGRADEVEILRDLPMGLGEAARNAVRQWRFLPATVNGKPIDVYYTVTVRFTMKGN
jgi:TonB family protein